MPFFVAVAMATVLSACRKGDAPAGTPPAEVSAAQVVVKPVRQWDEFNGRIAATDAVEVRARVSGYIERIAFKEGDEVKSGDLLFVIDPRPYKAAYDSEAAQLERARAAAQMARARDERAGTLLADKAISREEFDTRQGGRAGGRGGADHGRAQSRLHRGALGDRWARRPRHANGRQSGPGRPERADQRGLTGSGLRLFPAGRADLSALRGTHEEGPAT